MRRADSLKSAVERRLAVSREDPAIDALPPDLRLAVARRWADRADNELSTSTTFAELYRGLVVIGVDPPLLEVAARAVEDELRHHLICRCVSERYAGAELRPGRMHATEPPRFSGCTDREARILHTVLHTCLNEGVAAAYLGACLDDAGSLLARDAVKDILRDEVVHARLGWAFVSSLSTRERDLVAEALPELVREVEKLWLRLDGFEDDPPRGHGVIGLAGIRRVFDEAMRDLILPGFVHVGIPVT